MDDDFDPGYVAILMAATFYEGSGRWRTNAPDLSLWAFGQGRTLVMPDDDDPEQAAKDHGHLMDEGVAEVEREADEAAGGQNHVLADRTPEPPSPTNRATGATAFSEAQMAEEASESQKGPSESAESKSGNDEQAGELLAEQIAEAEDSVT
jgi:hypothetical protein